MAENKVNFGLKNVHYSKITIDAQGKTVYGAPTPIPGAVELSLEPQGDLTPFYADDIVYYITSSNNGYEGTLTIANIPQQFAVDCLGEVEDAEHGVITEVVNEKKHNFALMFEFDGDQKATRHIIYNCTCNRPTVGGSTKTDTAEPFTNELSFRSMSREDLKVKTKTNPSTPAHIYDAWYRKVYDGIKNTSTPVNFTLTAQQAGKLTFTLSNTEGINVTGVTNNGVPLRVTTDYVYTGTARTLELTDTYVATLKAGVHNIVAATPKGNDIAIPITRQA